MLLLTYLTKDGVCYINISTSRQIDLECGFSSLVLSEKLFLCWQVFEGFVCYDGGIFSSSELEWNRRGSKQRLTSCLEIANRVALTPCSAKAGRSYVDSHPRRCAHTCTWTCKIKCFVVLTLYRCVRASLECHICAFIHVIVCLMPVFDLNT